MNESQATALFRRQHPGGFWKKLHGNEFQPNLPDILWIIEGITYFLEFKIVKGTKLPWSKCRLGQHLTMREMAAAGGRVLYVVYSISDVTFFTLPPVRVIEGQSTDLESVAEVWRVGNSWTG